MQVDKSLPFLTEFVESALTNGARPYVPENERVEMNSGMSSFVSGSHEQPESSSHTLRFEAYETPTVPSSSIPTTSGPAPALLPDFPEKKPESPRSLRRHIAADSTPVDLLGPEISRLRLDGVQKKWGRPATSSQLATPSSDREKETGSNGVSEAVSSQRESPSAGGEI